MFIRDIQNHGWSGSARSQGISSYGISPAVLILVIHIRSQVKKSNSQSYKFKKNDKNSNFEILQEALHVSHLLKMLDTMYKYEMDPTRTVGATEHT